jgi:5-oxoprolinase (ATP-hydrolysing) subunit C
MTSLQDAGRIGWQRYGISNSGAMDRLALAAANALVGNPPGAAGVEFVLLGGSFAVEGGSARLALAGAPFGLTLDGDRVPSHVSVTLRPGQILTLSPPAAGVYAVLAAAGGFDVPTALGSLSLHPRARLGGLDGRPLREGDRIPLVLPQAPDGPEFRLPPLPFEPEAAIRVVLGPQADHFADAAIAAFLSATYRVSQEADRMGYRLNGPRIPHARGFNIVSDGIATGSVQVPGSGEPIVLMEDRQTAGGYPKIATVISADHRVLAQRRPGDPVRFAALEVEAAQALARERAALAASLPTRVASVLRAAWSPEDLLRLNLAGEAVNAFGGR